MNNLTVTIERDWEEVQNMLDGWDFSQEAIMRLPQELSATDEQTAYNIILLQGLMTELRNALITDMERTLADLSAGSKPGH